METPVTTVPQTEYPTSIDAQKFVGKLPQLQDDFPVRLAMVSAGYAIIWTIFSLLTRLLYPPERLPGFSYILDLVAVTCSAIMFLVARSNINRHQLKDIGLMYEVVGAFFIAWSETFLPVVPDVEMGFISWICVWVAVFPLLVPSTMGKSLLAALTAATMGPVAYMLSVSTGRTPLPVMRVVELYLPNYFAVIISIMSIYVMTRYARQIRMAQRMGSYELVELLGKGGMGEVWKAQHQMLARPAAVKLIKPELLQKAGTENADTTRTRFHLEAQTIASLRSPHTVELYDFGVTDASTFYYAMELLDGINLNNLVKKFGPVPPERVVHILRQTCKSLAEAHRNGMIHRDIKPANIVLCRLGLEHDFTKVLDFGLAKRVIGDTSEIQLTAEGVISGTPAYLAPEIILGEKMVDGRVDIYALGCVAYWLLTGHMVFDSESQMKMAMDHVNTPPVPPSKRTEIGIPPALEEIVMSCLEKLPGKRPPSAEELFRRLSLIHFDHPWTPERSEKWWKTHFPKDEVSTPIPNEPIHAGDRPS